MDGSDATISFPYSQGGSGRYNKALPLVLAKELQDSCYKGISVNTGNCFFNVIKSDKDLDDLDVPTGHHPAALDAALVREAVLAKFRPGLCDRRFLDVGVPLEVLQAPELNMLAAWEGMRRTEAGRLHVEMRFAQLVRICPGVGVMKGRQKLHMHPSLLCTGTDPGTHVCPKPHPPGWHGGIQVCGGKAWAFHGHQVWPAT